MVNRLLPGTGSTEEYDGFLLPVKWRAVSESYKLNVLRLLLPDPGAEQHSHVQDSFSN